MRREPNNRRSIIDEIIIVIGFIGAFYLGMSFGLSMVPECPSAPRITIPALPSDR
jgi:hypothetical protein